MVCKHKMRCDYISMCSRVASTLIFRVKILFPKHKCRKVFLNKNFKALWVVKLMVDKFKNNIKMKLSEIVSDVRIKYAIEILGCKGM